MDDDHLSIEAHITTVYCVSDRPFEDVAVARVVEVCSRSDVYFSSTIKHARTTADP